jgi:hypothetical protein
MTLHISLLREPRDHNTKTRFRAQIRATQDGPVILEAARAAGSAAAARRELETLLGPLEWSESNTTTAHTAEPTKGA